ncbi:Nramp family divalent metal transporter [Brevundimonas sp.]|uniref:Nramp family divalent metal transporter n=1 Tax=Brevundimonas sp. TaxID=1871086 RepID=UPI002AB98BC9|nr:Nramp family divalent metal transporter [Brevundimonas sp.]MDZ4362208.1 Nramp family divalent metal transporter [Brevundimonas sp.]
MTQVPPDTVPPKRLSLIGPGIIVAATGVGAGDLVATLIAGSRFGYALLWAAVLGAVLKIALAEGVGRWVLSSGRTIFDGWSSLPGATLMGGRLNWAGVYFGLYVVVWGFVYGAAAMTATALPLAALWPVLDLKAWGILSGLLGLGMVWFGNYRLFETVMTALVGVMFVTVVGLAVIVTPDLPRLLTGLWPTLPPGSVFYTLGLIGGVGGTITMAAYGYWLNAKGWRGPAWIGVMRIDNRIAYGVTGLFVVAMLIVGAELLNAGGIALAGGERGLLDLDQVLRDRFGQPVSVMFLIGFLATSFTSLLGVWQGVSLMFADFTAHLAGRSSDETARGDRSPAFRAYVLWLTFPPMLLLFMDRPFGLIVAYGVLGSLFMPFLAGTLLWLLNTNRVPTEWRSGWVSNLLLAGAAVLFAVLAGRELIGLFSG